LSLERGNLPLWMSFAGVAGRPANDEMSNMPRHDGNFVNN
jgi:hypothetical protein